MVAPQLDLGEDLVTETVGHDEAGVTHGTAQVNKSALSQQQDVLTVGQCVAVNLRLDVGLGLAVILQPLNLDLTVEVTDVAHDGAVLHLKEVLASQDVSTAGGGHKNVASAYCV